MTVLFEGTRRECHAFLAGVLLSPWTQVSSDEVQGAYMRGLELRQARQHPLAECRVDSEEGTGRVIHRVVDPGGS